jgi:lipopolysaccharide heptosyltransferase I
MAVRRIGIVKLSSLGDVVHALPVLAALRRALPGARLAWIVEAREAALLTGHPDLDDLVAVDTRRWRRQIVRPAGLAPVARALGGVLGRLRRLELDAAIDLQGLMKSGVITAMTSAPLRVGFAAAHCRERLNAVFTNRRVAPPAGAVHAVERCLALLAPLGIRPGPAEFRLPECPEARGRMETFLGEQGIKRRELVVALNPGAAREEKRWPIAHWRALGERIHAEGGARLLVLWGPDEAHMAREIKIGLGGAAILAPPTDLHELSALLGEASLVIAGDTGPLHLAAALGTPALGLYGPTRAERNGPYGVRCRSLQSPDGTMAGLPPEAAAEAALGMLARIDGGGR